MASTREITNVWSNLGQFATNDKATFQVKSGSIYFQNVTPAADDGFVFGAGAILEVDLTLEEAHFKAKGATAVIVVS